MKKGWEIKKIGDVCDLMTGGTPSKSKPEYFANGNIRWLVSGDIHQKEIFDCEGRITEEGMRNSNAKYLPVNSVIIALSGQGKTRGSVALLRTKATCNQSLVSICPKDLTELQPEYIYFNLHGRYEEIRKITGDDEKDRRGLNMGLVRNIEIPIPPLPEQQRIVSVLDEALASIAHAKSSAEQNLVNTRELFESVLERIFDDGEDWEEKLLGDVCKVAGELTRDIDSSLPYIGADSIKSNSGRLLQKKTVLEQGIRGPVSFFSGKKLLYSKIRPYLNKVSITDFKGYCSSDMYPLEFDKSVLYEFASHYLLSKRFMKSIGGFYERAAIPKINREQLFSVSFPVPPLAEQRLIVGRLEALSAETKRLEGIYQRKVESLEELKKSVLQKAFEGEL